MKKRRHWINESGNRYGRLTVIEEVPDKRIRGQVVWRCVCDCGNQIISAGNTLRKGYTKSCGCLAIEERSRKPSLPGSQYGFNRYFRTVLKGAKERGYEFNLTKEQVLEISSQNCFYCGAEPSNGAWTSNKRPHREYFIYNGLDRVDNTRGYFIDNVVPCCKKCNYAKNKFSVQDFKYWIIRVYNHWASN